MWWHSDGSLTLRVHDGAGYVDVASSNFAQGSDYSIDVWGLGSTTTVFINGATQGSFTVDRSGFAASAGTTVWLGQTWGSYAVADVSVKNVRYTNLDSASCAPTGEPTQEP